MQEWDPETKNYTGRELDARVDYILPPLPFLDLGDYVIMSVSREASRVGVERAGGLVIPPQALGEPMPQLTPPPPTELDKSMPVQPAAPEPAPTPPAIAFANKPPEIMVAHQEKLRIAEELCKTAAQKVVEAGVQA